MHKFRRKYGQANIAHSWRQLKSHTITRRMQAQKRIPSPTSTHPVEVAHAPSRAAAQSAPRAHATAACRQCTTAARRRPPSAPASRPAPSAARRRRRPWPAAARCGTHLRRGRDRQRGEARQHRSTRISHECYSKHSGNGKDDCCMRTIGTKTKRTLDSAKQKRDGTIAHPCAWPSSPCENTFRRKRRKADTWSSAAWRQTLSGSFRTRAWSDWEFTDADTANKCEWMSWL